MNEIKILSVGLKLDDTSTCLEQLLWFINHCNIPMTNKYVFEAGTFEETTELGRKLILVVTYKDVVIIFKTYYFPFIKNDINKERIYKEFNRKVYYELMNTFLLWTGADSVSKSITNYRETHNYIHLVASEYENYKHKLKELINTIRKDESI